MINIMFVESHVYLFILSLCACALMCSSKGSTKSAPQPQREAASEAVVPVVAVSSGEFHVVVSNRR